MKQTNVRKLAQAALLCALAVAGSTFSFPIFGSRCAPIQHLVNILASVLLGPGYSVGIAFCASLIRVSTGLGSLMAFPGSMFGALLSGLLYRRFKTISSALIGEVFGTSILGGLCAYPVAVFLMGQNAGTIAFYAYVIPFLISTASGAMIAFVVLIALQKAGVIARAQTSLQN